MGLALKELTVCSNPKQSSAATLPYLTSTDLSFISLLSDFFIFFLLSFSCLRLLICVGVPRPKVYWEIASSSFFSFFFACSACTPLRHE